MLSISILISASDTVSDFYEVDRGEREYRVNTSFVYVLVGVVLLAAGVAVEAAG